MASKTTAGVTLELSVEEYGTLVTSLRKAIEYGCSYQKRDARELLISLGETVEEEYDY